MNKFLFTLCFFLYGAAPLFAQTAPPSTLEGTELKVWLRENWYDGKRQVLDYGTARGKMYNYVDNYNNTVTCVYSGYDQPWTYSETSTTTSSSTINCEHTIPQSWFNETERMRTDIHHLYPTVIQWNSDRGSDPFAEIPDNQTIKWIRNLTAQSTIPTTNIDEYSEDTNTQFEPREDHKGNLARSVFYFYTMHAGQSFDSGKNVLTAVADANTLYQWHIQDPVDDRERERNRRVEVAQGNRNPYIDYPELVAKAWGFATLNCSPETQITSLTATAKSISSITLSWAKGSGDRRLIVVREGGAAAFTPTGSYSNVNSNFSLGTAGENNYKVVYNGSGSAVTVTGLSANTAYHVQAFEYCAATNTYNTTAAPALAVTTPDYTCNGIPNAVTNVSADAVTSSGFKLNWANGSGDGRMVVIRKEAAVAFVPANGTAYNGANANYTQAETLTDGSKLVYNGDGSSVTVTGLESGVTYHVQVFESCAKGMQYHTENAPVLTVTTTAINNGGDGILLTIQNFNATAADGWVVTSGFSSSSDNSGYPDGQRVRTGSSLQTAGLTNTVEFAEVSIAGKSGVYVELYNSVVSTTSGNGMDGGDMLEVYVALNGSNYSATPDIKITADASDNNIRYGMNGTLVFATPAGEAFVKTYIAANGETGDLAADKAPSVIRVLVPDGSTAVKLKVIVKTNNAKEVWNIDDVALFGETGNVDCDANVLEGHAGEDKTFCAGTAGAIGKAAVAGYTYSWSPATGLSSATAANPAFNLTTPGEYTYTVTATQGSCTFTDEVRVIVNAIPTAPVITQSSNTLTASETGTAYEWFRNGELLAGKTTQTIEITAAGTYKARVKNTAGCFSAYSAELQVTDPLSIKNEAAKAGFTIFPNPAAGSITVQVLKPMGQVQLQLLDAVGRVVHKEQFPVWNKTATLDVSNLPTGIYHLHVYNKEVHLIQKVMVIR